MAIVIKRSDDGISVMMLRGDALEASLLAPDQMDVIIGAEIAQWSAADQEAVASWREVPDSEIPKDKSLWAEVLG